MTELELILNKTKVELARRAFALDRLEERCAKIEVRLANGAPIGASDPAKSKVRLASTK
jgi:hypothetical protein